MTLAVLDGARSIEAALIAGDPGRPVNLSLSASTTIGNYVLPQLLARFCSQFPSAQLEVRIGNSLDVVTSVQNFGFGPRPDRGPMPRARNDRDATMG